MNFNKEDQEKEEINESLDLVKWTFVIAIIAIVAIVAMAFLDPMSGKIFSEIRPGL